MKYFSEELNKTFDSVKELQAAEKAAKEEAEKKANLVELKKAKANAISEAYKNLVQVEKDARDVRVAEVNAANKKYEDSVKEAEDKYNELKNDFINEYGSYHLSYYSNNGDTQIAISDMINSIFDSFNSFRLF